MGSWAAPSTGRIYKFDINGGGSKTLIATLAGIGGITGDASGNIYVGQTNAGIVSKVTPSGDVTTYATGLNNPDGIAFAPDGKLYVASRNGQLKVVPAGGGASANFATLSPSIMRIRADNAGNVYALNADLHTISKISPGGAVSAFGSGFDRPHGIVFDASGSMFISNAIGNVIHKVPGVG